MENTTELKKLIKRGVIFTERKKAAEAGLADVKTAIDKFFDKNPKQTKEVLSCEFGKAERTISRSYSIEPINIRLVREFLSDSYNEYVDEKTSYKPTAKLRTLINEGDAEALAGLVVKEESASIKFIPAEA